MLIDLKYLIDKYQLQIDGVVHIGAHYGEEIKTYNDNKIRRYLLFEASKDAVNKIIESYPDIGEDDIVEVALGSKSFDTYMNTETKNNGQSNSILNPLLHLKYYPDIIFEQKEKVRVETLDYIIGAYSDYLYNMINIDVQGYELEVFKGGTSFINNCIDYIYCEVNREPLYENCAMVEEIDGFLSQYNFKRVETKWTNQGWGDALYIKSKQ